MSRLAILVAAALVLPSTGTKPALVTAPSNTAPVVTASWAPRLHMPHLPRFNRKRGTAAEMAQMNTRLRSLVGQQESWYANNGVYGRDAARIEAAKRNADAAAVSRVQVEILYAGKKGWTAMASHPDAPGKSCVVYVGFRDKLPLIPRTRAEALEATMEGIPACDSK